MLQGRANLAKEMPSLPGPDESFALITEGGFASVSFVLRVCEELRVRELCVSTFRVGKKETLALDRLHQDGRLDRCAFLVSGLSEGDSEKYPYYRVLKQVCDQNRWPLGSERQHSKVLLFDCGENARFVLETSSNLNENPKIEQFRFERDPDLWEFYRTNLFARYVPGFEEAMR